MKGRVFSQDPCEKETQAILGENLMLGSYVQKTLPKIPYSSSMHSESIFQHTFFRLLYFSQIFLFLFGALWDII